MRSFGEPQRFTLLQQPAEPRHRAAPVRAAVTRAYAAARHTRTTDGFGGATTSADTELAASLSTLRNRSRQMVRDAAYAKRARNLVVNNVIGPGIGIQAQVMASRKTLRRDVNDSIETAWLRWCEAEHCHTGGTLHFADLERAAMAQVFEAGEVFIRVHEQRFGRSDVPLALELVEPERIADGIAEPGAASPAAELRMGVEVDRRFQRPLAYWVRQRHPGDLRHPTGGDLAERVPASEMYHLRIVTRWPQTRGEPWLHAVVRKLDDINETSQLEITAARGAAAYFATIKTPESEPDDAAGDEGDRTFDLEPLTVRKLDDGEELDFHAPNRPNAQLDPFLRMMLREVAVGTETSYASLSGDYSQTNYSSSRLALLDDRDLWRVLQQWWIRAFRLPLHRRWLRQAVLARAVRVPAAEYAGDMAKFEAVRFKPRGWSWVDPTKEVEAYKEGVRGGLTTLTDVIAATGEGRDIEDFIALRTRELDLLREAGILVDTTVQAVQTPASKPAPKDGPPADDEDDAGADSEDGETARRVFALHRGAA